MGDSRFARCLQGGGVAVWGGTVTISSASISGNTAANVVCTRAQNFPSLQWENALLTCPIRLSPFFWDPILFYQAWVCASHAQNFPLPSWEAHVRFAGCLQGGGGVLVSSGTVTISSCTISGNSAGYVRAHAQKFPSPHGISTCFALVLAGRRCKRLEWHSGHLIVRHQREHSSLCARSCSKFAFAPIGFSHVLTLVLAGRQSLCPERHGNLLIVHHHWQHG